jgi:splicing factor 45
MLAKYGWQEGQGLGRDEAGMKEALEVKPTGSGSGIIVDHPPSQTRVDIRKEVTSPVILLTNMVGPGEVDDMLQEETADECSKYGKVERCLIFEVRITFYDIKQDTRLICINYRYLEEKFQMIEQFVFL